jgi:hypothetical protein
MMSFELENMFKMQWGKCECKVALSRVGRQADIALSFKT